MKSDSKKFHGMRTLSFLFKNFENKTSFMIYFSTSLYLICVGLFIKFLMAILISLPIIMIYPYINPLLLEILTIMALAFILLGITTGVFPVFKQNIMKNKLAMQIIIVILKISAITTMVLIPIGVFLGKGLYSELSMNNSHERNENKNIEKEATKPRFFLQFSAGFVHVLFGGLIISWFPSLYLAGLNLLFPYINYQLFVFITIIGWTSFLTGLLLTFCSIWLKKLKMNETIVKRKRLTKILNKITFISSIFMTLIFPLGTFFGLIIIQESWRIKPKKSKD